MNGSVFDARAERRDVLRGAFGLAAGAIGAGLAAGLGTSVAHASTGTFPIKIDATPLVYRYFIIPGVTSNWVDSRTVQSFNLAPGEYSFQVASGYYADFTFRVTPLGTIDFDVALVLLGPARLGRRGGLQLQARRRRPLGVQRRP